MYDKICLIKEGNCLLSLSLFVELEQKCIVGTGSVAHEAHAGDLGTEWWTAHHLIMAVLPKGQAGICALPPVLWARDPAMVLLPCPGPGDAGGAGSW